MEPVKFSSQLQRFGACLGSVLSNSFTEAVSRLCEKSSVYKNKAAAADLNVAQWFLLCFMQALFAEDLLLSRFLITLSTSLIQLKSTYLRKWLREDFNFVREDVVRGMNMLMTQIIQENVQVPEVLLEILSGLIVKYNIDNFMTENDGDLPDASLCRAVESNNVAEAIAAVKRGANVDMKINSGDSLYHLAVDLNCLESIAGLGYLKARIEALDADFASPIQRAVLKDNGKAVLALVAAGADWKIKVKDGNTLVHLAVMEGFNNVLNTLLKIGADCNVKNYKGLTPAFLAVRLSNAKAVELLLERGVDRNSDELLLHEACELNNVDIVRKLVRAGWGRTGVRNEAGLLPIHICRDNSIVEDLLLNGASIDGKTTSGNTALHLAASEGNIDLLQFLIRSGANVNEINYKGETPISLAACNNKEDVVKLLLEKRAKTDEQDKIGFTSLHRAVECGSLSILKIFQAVGVNLRITTSEGLNILHIALLHGHNHIVHYLLDNAMYDDLNTTCNFIDWSYETKFWKIIQPFTWTVLHLAAFKGDLAVIQTLLASTYSDPNVKDNHNLTPLDLAACSGKVSVVKELLEHGAKFENGCPALHFAADRGNLEILKLLVENGAGVNSPYNSATPLHVAASQGHLEIITFLLDNQAGINEKFGGHSSIHLAYFNKHKDVIKLLVSRGGSCESMYRFFSLSK